MIFYFSGTGNTRWVAQQIAEAIGEELISIPDAIRQGQYSYTLQTDERLGFCFPTHGWQPPRIVRDFIAQMQVQNSHFCWALTTCGDNMGECMTILNKDLRPKGLEAETLFSVIMPESYVCLPFMYTDTEEKETWKLENAQHQPYHPHHPRPQTGYRRTREGSHSPTLLLRSGRVFQQTDDYRPQVHGRYRGLYQMWEMHESLSC